MKNIIERIVGGAKIARYLPKAVSTRLAVAALAAPSARAVAMLLAVCVIGLAKADTMTVMGDDVTICSSATSLDQLGIATLTGKINFYTPSGCSAGDKLVFTKLEMLKSTGNTVNTKTNATTITITVDGVKYTSSPVVDSSAPSSLGNVTSGIGSDHHLLTYNFPNVIVEAGSSYDVSFNGSGLTELRCRMESTASGTVFTAPASGNWKPYGVITAAPVLASTPVIGSRIILGNTGTSGAISDSGAGECNISLTIPAFSGLPVGSVVRVKNVSLAGWNDSFKDWDADNKKSDPYFIKINNIISKSLQGTTTNPGSAPSIDLTVSKIQANDSTTLNRLFFEYANTCDLTVGTSYAAPAKNANSAGTGLALCYRNGNLIFSSTPKDVGGVRYVEAATASVLSSTAATGAYPIYEMLLEVVSKPTQTATIDAEGSYTLAGLFSGTASDGVYVINVNESATLDIDAAATVDQITFNVAAGKTLTLTGNTLTASEIAFTGAGVATTQNMSIFSGTLAGDGTLCYDMNNGTTKPSGIVCTSDDWAGMLWIKNGAYTGWNFNTEDTGYIKYGGANSTLRLENVTCYLNATETVGFTLDLHGEGLKITNGNGYKVETVKKLTGSGTLAISGGSSNGNGFIIQDGSEFAGSINITTGNYVVNFADSGTYATSGKIIVGSGETATVASGKTWSTTNQNGIEINGTLTLADSTSTLTGAISGSGTLVANQQFPVPGSSFTGTLTISGDGTSGTYCSETEIYGSRLNVAEGYVILTGDITTLPDSIDIQSGATLYFYQCPATSLSLKMGTWNGMLYFYNCTALTTLTLDAGAKRSFSMTDDLTLPAGTLTTVNLVLDEVKGEGGTITLSNTAAISAIAGRTYNFTVNRVDGTTVTGTYDSAASTVSYTPSISGAATDIDWDFTDGEDDDLEQKPSGVGKSADSTMTFYTDATDSTKTGVYIKHHPYITGAASFMGNNSAAMTVAVVGTMPATSNTIFLNVGSAYAQQYGLVFLTTANANEVLIGYNYGGTVTPITTMTVPNSSTARHSYIVTKVDGSSTTTFTVYLDGIKWKTVTTASKIAFASLNSGVQVGSDFGGNIRSAGTYSAASDDVGVLNVLRVYGRIITEAEIAVYADTFPYVSPNGASSRTFATAAEEWVEATDTDWTNTDSSGDVTSGTEPTAGASVTVTASTATEITVNLDSETSYEALTINGSAVTLASGGSGDIKVTGMTVIGAPVTVEYGAADFTGGPMTITEDGSITFDYSAYDISEIYTTTYIPLTSDVDQDNTKVTLTPPIATYQTATLVYRSGQYEMCVTPVHEAGTELYYKSGYWSSTENSFSVVDSNDAAAPIFPGDVVIIDSTHATVSEAWVADTFPANLTSVRIAKNFTFHSGVSAAIFGGVTVAVDEGVTLTLNNSGSQNSITLGAATLDGPGSVAIADTIGISGAVTGTAVLTISGTVNVASGGSIANTLAGSGTLAFAAVPSSALTLGDWTGTVSLPSFWASSGVNFNNYGTTDSTVALAEMTGGYILEAGKTISPTLQLNGDMTITTMSSWTYTFAEITGSGNLSFSTNQNDPTVEITKVAEGYSGTITSTLANTVTIATLAREAGTSIAAGAKLLNTGNATSVTVEAVTVGGEAVELDLEYKADGVYVSELQGIGYWDGTTAAITNTSATVDISGLTSATAVVLYPTGNSVPFVATLTQLQNISTLLSIKVKYTVNEGEQTQDITSAFTSGSLSHSGDNYAMTLSFSGTDSGNATSVTVGNETIPVTPVAGSESATVVEGKPTIPVKTIPGLWYSLESCDTANGTFAAETTVQATSTTTSLTTTAEPNPVKYYKIGVDVAAPAE